MQIGSKDDGQEPVVWLTQFKLEPHIFELAEPNETASNPRYWTDAFPVYRHPQPATQQGEE